MNCPANWSIIRPKFLEKRSKTKSQMGNQKVTTSPRKKLVEMYWISYFSRIHSLTNIFAVRFQCVRMIKDIGCKMIIKKKFEQLYHLVIDVVVRCVLLHSNDLTWCGFSFSGADEGCKFYNFPVVNWSNLSILDGDF